MVKSPSKTKLPRFGGALLLLSVGLTAGGCLEPFEYQTSEKYGFEYDGPAALLSVVESAWEPFDDAGIEAPWMVTILNERQLENCGCEGSYGFGGSVKAGESLCALPHEFAHHASQMLYGHAQNDHQWTPEVRALLNAAADIIGCGNEP
jgi:hypothetical protein